MAERLATYSRIISPEDYNRIISFEHVYISASDRVVRELIEKYKPADRVAEVVELGCGPARILPMMTAVPGIHVTGIDHDPAFVACAREHVAALGMDTRVEQGDFTTWSSDRPIDIFYSQGVHHHVAKGEDLSSYLDNVARQLSVGGVYVLSDEFLPEYSDEQDRKKKAVVWYSHVIAAAKRARHDYLAEEEAKTLLDDLSEGERGDEVKSRAQIESVLASCDAIDETARAGDLGKSDELATAFLGKLGSQANTIVSGDDKVDLSRGDYKICDSVFRTEVGAAGFEVVERRTVGPVDTIGGMAVYVLRKS